MINPKRQAPNRSALIAAAAGIGDIVRATPLVCVLQQLGYAVDFLLEPDYPEIVDLFRGAPEIRHLYMRASKWSGQSAYELQGLAQQQYDLAIFTLWASALQSMVHAKQKIVFEQRQWLQDGDAFYVRKIAAALGWQQPMPRPFVLPSPKKFDLMPGTIALHPGCKPNWPWKKWHGFDELAALLPEVVIVGTKADMQNEGTYFQREFQWPSHARVYLESLSLPDTVALVSQCTALVSNDSGLMHVGAAVGIPTFGIFGLTDPAREVMPLENMFPIANVSACLPACRRLPWGSKNCQNHLNCLRSLTPQEVRCKIAQMLADG